MSVKWSRFSRRDVGGVHTNQHANIMATDTSDISPGKLNYQTTGSFTTKHRDVLRCIRLKWLTSKFPGL